MFMGRSVLILGEYPPPFGGVGIHVRSFVPYLIEQGYQVRVVSAGREPGVEEADGFTVHRLVHEARDNARVLARRLPSVVAEFARSRFADIDFLKSQAITAVAEPLVADADMICAYHLLPWGFAAARLAERFGLPLCMVNFGEVYAAEAHFRRHARQIRYVASQASELVSVSQHCARSLSQVGIDREVDVIPMGVDVDALSPSVDGSVMRARLGIGDGEPVVLYLGRMHQNLGLHTVLEALPSFVGRARTIIAGARSDLTPAAEAFAAAHPGRVSVIPDFPFEDLAGFYAAADVVLAPSPDNRPCMGLAIKEAMASGKPVIACDIGGIPEAVVHEGTGLLTPAEDSEALGAAVGRLLDDPAECARLGAAGRERAIDLFSVQRTNERLEGVFARMLGL